MLTSPPPALPGDAVTFTLYKLAVEVGVEQDTFVTLPDGEVEAKAIFSYVDRKTPVPLAARFAFDPTGALHSYAAWGSTSRHSSLDDHVDARDGAFQVSRAASAARMVHPDGLAIAASGYAPMLAQSLMLRAWNQHGRPAKMQMLPEGEVSLESRGRETYDTESGKVTLEHIGVSGLLWGREDAWLDDKGELAAVVTRDAEFDHHEATRDGFARLLPQLTRAAGADGVAWLEQAAKGAERVAAGSVAFVGGTLIDGTGRPPVNDAVLVLLGDRIVAAGPRDAVKIPAGATVTDVSGKWIIPGLWDMHAHVEQVEQGSVYLAAGVTTVRDMGNILEFIMGVRDAIDSGKGLGPRVLAQGIVDGGGDGAIGTVRITKREEIAPVIDRLKKAGCQQVKIYSHVDPSLVKPIIAYAHAHGMGAVGHVPVGMTSREAILAGYDSISHVRYLFDAVLPDSVTHGLSREARLDRFAAVDLAAPAMAGELALLVSHHVVIDDTLALFEQLLHTREEDARREPGIRTLPPELAATLDGEPPALATRAEAAFAKYMGLMTELHRRGVVVVPGTDITVPGHSLHRELELYVQAGWTPMEALQAAAIVPARFMHLDRELGTLEAGKRADLVILSGDPLSDIHNVRKTALVVARGRTYDSAALWKLAGFHPN